MFEKWSPIFGFVLMLNMSRGVFIHKSLQWINFYTAYLLELHLEMERKTVLIFSKTSWFRPHNPIEASVPAFKKNGKIISEI